jgi:hypothetical protein
MLLNRKLNRTQPWPSNNRIQPTPLRVERDRGVFEGWIHPDTRTDLSVRRG